MSAGSAGPGVYTAPHRLHFWFSIACSNSNTWVIAYHRGLPDYDSLNGLVGTLINQPRPGNLWVIGGFISAVERGSGGVCGRWLRRSVVPPLNRCERVGHPPRGSRFAGDPQQRSFLEKGRS